MWIVYQRIRRLIVSILMYQQNLRYTPVSWYRWKFHVVTRVMMIFRISDKNVKSVGFPGDALTRLFHQTIEETIFHTRVPMASDWITSLRNNLLVVSQVIIVYLETKSLKLTRSPIIMFMKSYTWFVMFESMAAIMTELAHWCSYSLRHIVYLGECEYGLLCFSFVIISPALKSLWPEDGAMNLST